MDDYIVQKSKRFVLRDLSNFLIFANCKFDKIKFLFETINLLLYTL